MRTADHIDTGTRNDAHARALALLEDGDARAARAVLREAVHDVIDPEMLNDLAVLALQCGDEEEGRDLLRALVRLHPDHLDASANLRAVDSRPRGGGTTQAAAPAGDADRRTRLLQVISEGLQTHIADNVDHLFHPWGCELPDPAGVGQRIAAQLEILDRADTFWRCLGDEESRSLWLRFLAYRALGPAHVRLQLEPDAYRRTVIGLSAGALRQACAVRLPGLPLEWQLHLYDFSGLGLPIRAVGPPLPLASTMCFSQYAYRDPSVAGRPRAGDVALDVGGCWGETALWLANAVGAGGQVHTFEPSPSNRRLLEQNLQLNPELAAHITVWGNPVASRADETLWIPDVIAAGATVQERVAGSEECPMVQLRTTSIDALCRARALPRVDFIKIDVEGADLGVLEGAAETIRAYRPRIAVACYHKPDDLVRIPDFVASLDVSYRWYLQCSTMTDIDTVAFAVPD
jgi:FkbM family methyltransferase